MTRIFVFSFILLLSGLSGISYEILYGRLLGSLLGDQFAVSASVLITFLLGIGIGSRYAHYFWRWLWLIEGSIGVYGILFASNIGNIDRLIYSGSMLLPGLAGSILMGTLLLLVPSFLIGCSVPLFAGYLGRLNNDRAFSRVYALYNIGAAITALLIEFWLIRKFGISGTVMVFGAVNMIAAVLLLVTASDMAKQLPSKIIDALTLPKQQVASLILVSIASAIFQLFMVKLAEMMFGPFRESFALVLAIVLFGIAAGSFLVTRLRIAYKTLLLVNLLALATILPLFDPLISLYAQLYSVAAANNATVILFLKGSILFALMGIPALTFGATIPALINETQENVAAESGRLLFIASLANVAGFLLMALVLHQYLDYGVQLLVMAGLVVAALLVDQWRRYWVGGFAVVVLGSAISFHHWRWDENLLYLSYTSFQSAKEMNEDRSKFDFPERFKGYQDVFSINWVDGDPYFFINGYISFPMNNPSEKIVGLISSMFAPRAQEGLVLGLGSGSTGSVVGLLLDHTDIIEINPVVRANQARMKQWNFDIEHNPKVNIIVDDAIHYVKTSEKQYDLILNTVTSPLYFSSAKLYTQDFFNIVKPRLRKDGVYATWMDSRIGSRGAEIVINTLKKTFKHCGIVFIKSGYFLLLASDEPIHLQHKDLAARSPELIKDLVDGAERLPRLFVYNLMTPDVYPLVKDGDAPLNTIDYPELEFELAHLDPQGLKNFRQKLLDHISFDEVQSAVEPTAPYDAAEHVAHIRNVLKESTITDGWNDLGAVYIRDAEAKINQATLQMWREMVTATGTAKAHHSLGYALLKDKQYDAALVEFNAAIAIDPQYKYTQFNIGSTQEQKKNYEASLAAFTIAGQQAPDDADIPYRKAGVHLKLQQYDLALSEIEQALKLQQDGSNLLRRGRILEAMGRKDEAIQAYIDAFNSSSDDEEIQQALNKYLAKW